MGKRDPRVDAYITRSADFAKPILTRIRSLVHEAIPQVDETMKWGVPHFEYKGVICGMAAFKQHCNLILWKGSLIPGTDGRDAAGNVRKITSVSDLPPDATLTDYFRQAARLNEQGVKAPRQSKSKATKPVVVPAELTTALKKNKRAAAAFEKFPPSHKREYADWISEAKGEDTRKRRVESAVKWIAEGKSRNWKYEKR